jgi:ribosomal protein S18 acetylase RimI-like enzyme
MSETRPRSPVRRPETARPRRDRAAEEPAPPTSDELLRIERGLDQLAVLGGAALAIDEPAGRLVAWPSHGPAYNFGAGVRWSPSDVEARASELAARLREIGELPALVVAEGLSEPPDLITRLAERGWVGIGHETVHWTRLPITVPHLDPTLRTEAATAARAADYERVERRIFGLSPADAADRRTALAATLGDGRQRAFVVRLRGEPVATARLASVEGLAAIHGVGVVPEQRRKGFGRLVTAVATRAGLATGHPLVWLSVDPANEPARELYLQLGYRPVFDWWRLIGPEP